MTFGVAIIKGTARRKWGKKHDCGSHGKLVVSDIAAIAGVSEQTIYLRIKAGVRGAELCAPAWESARGKIKAPCVRPALLMACKLARAFPDRVPTITEIQSIRPMSKSAAMRWRQGLRDAMEAA